MEVERALVKNCIVLPNEFEANEVDVCRVSAIWGLLGRGWGWLLGLDHSWGSGRGSCRGGGGRSTGTCCHVVGNLNVTCSSFL